MSFSASVASLVEESLSPLAACSPNWCRVGLGEVAEILNGFPWKSVFFNEHTGSPVIRIRDVTSGATETRYNGEITEGFWVEDGNLLVGMDGDFTSRIWNGGRALLNQRVCQITPNETYYLKKFLALTLPGYLQLIHSETHSITVKHLSSRTLSEIPLPLPPLAEQRRIVAKIDALSEASRSARARLDQIPRLVEKYKQALLAAAFRGDLTKDWREAQNAQAVWRATTLGDVADIQSGVTLGKKRTANTKLVKRPYLRVANVQRGWLRLDEIKEIEVSEQEAERLYLQFGDILMNEGGDRDKLGRGWIWEEQIRNCIHQNHVFRVRLHDGDFPCKFISVYANAFGQKHFFDEGTQTTNLASISKKRLSSLPLHLPQNDEAQEIVRRIETAFAWIDRIAAEAGSARKLLDKLDQAVLTKAFRGELVPQDPADEPASLLLERIRKERAAKAEASPKAGRGRKPKSPAPQEAQARLI